LNNEVFLLASRKTDTNESRELSDCSTVPGKEARYAGQFSCVKKSKKKENNRPKANQSNPQRQ
jgi:hypothetical protein